MTDVATPAQPPGGGASTAGTRPATEKATDVARSAGEAGNDLAGTAADQGRRVAEAAREEARGLYGQLRGQLSDQAHNQQKKAAERLYGVRDDLNRMAGGSEQNGPAAHLVRRAAGRMDQVAQWLQREPDELLDDVTSFARRRPGAFLAGAAVLGVLAGRLSKNILGGDGGSATGSYQPPVVRATARPVQPTPATPVQPMPATSAQPMPAAPVQPTPSAPVLPPLGNRVPGTGAGGLS